MLVRKKSTRVVHYGKGINDVDYKVTVHEELLPHPDGSRNQILVWKCPAYSKWVDLLKRVYCSKYHTKQPTYKGCTMEDGWHSLTEFKCWYDNNLVVGHGSHLDKDFLVVGNKHYSPDTCVLIPNLVNNFINTGANILKLDSTLPIGVSTTSKEGIYRSRCSDPFKRYPAEISRHSCPDEAHLAWKERKHQYACELADSEYCNDVRLAEALRTRFF